MSSIGVWELLIIGVVCLVALLVVAAIVTGIILWARKKK